MADWTSSASVSSRPACRSIAALRPPPARRTRPPRWFSPPRSSANPRPMVLRATAVASHTAFTPPRPAVSASLAATSRRPRSSRNGATASKRHLMAATSITSPKYDAKAENDLARRDALLNELRALAQAYPDHDAMRQSLAGGLVNTLV